MAEGKTLLIEKWLPFEAVGAESRRERGASSALPPLYFLHVWWARRPLVASRAAVLASCLPAWAPDWPESLRAKFPSEEAYKEWFTRLLGILGDPVEYLFPFPDMIARRYDIHSVSQKLVHYHWGDAASSGGIFAVCYDKIYLLPPHYLRDKFFYGTPSRLAYYIADE